MIRTVSAPYVYRYRRPDERHQLGRYATINVAHVGLEALRACRVRRDSPGLTNPSSVAASANDALALDQSLEVSDTRVLAEVLNGFSLEFRQFLPSSLNGGRNVAIDDAF
ncbi:unnamed protein product [Ectocarpus sp. 12 AP-2014]